MWGVAETIEFIGSVQVVQAVQVFFENLVERRGSRACFSDGAPLLSNSTKLHIGWTGWTGWTDPAKLRLSRTRRIWTVLGRLGGHLDGGRLKCR
jgi:hypothetical protein